MKELSSEHHRQFIDSLARALVVSLNIKTNKKLAFDAEELLTIKLPKRRKD